MRLMLTFFRAYPGQTMIMLVALLLAGIAEGIGLSALLPLLNIAIKNEKDAAGQHIPQNDFERVVIDILQDAGITPIAIGEGDKWPGMFWYAYLLTQMASPEEILGAANRSGSFDSPGFVAAGQKLEELVALEPFQEGSLGRPMTMRRA